MDAAPVVHSLSLAMWQMGGENGELRVCAALSDDLVFIRIYGFDTPATGPKHAPSGASCYLIEFHYGKVSSRHRRRERYFFRALVEWNVPRIDKLYFIYVV